MLDFTLKTYSHLLNNLKDSKYTFQRFSDFIVNPQNRAIVVRHDIDLKKRQALVFARLENNLNVRATYFFRTVRSIYDPEIIKQVAGLGHEIGYHYEDVSRARGDLDKAMKMFQNHLSKLRTLYPVKTICMHGKSLSRYDNKKLWAKYNYRDFEIIGEPYFDIDFNDVLYLTDTAQRWNGSDISVRDHVRSGFNFSFRTTFDIINHLDKLPDKIMLTVHPDRWTDNPLEWVRIKSVVILKNLIKKNILKKRKH
jgi:hypothetical protein